MSARTRSARSRRSTALACLISRITMRCSAWIRIRPSYSNATTAYAVNTPRSTSGARDSVISIICGVVSTLGHSSSIPPCCATSVGSVEAPDGRRPLLIDFVAPTSLLREPNRTSALPVIGNGPPGTFVLFPMASECRCLPIRLSSPTIPAVTPELALVGCGSWDQKRDAWYSCGFVNCSQRISSHRIVVTRCCSTCSGWPQFQ